MSKNNALVGSFLPQSEKYGTERVKVFESYMTLFAQTMNILLVYQSVVDMCGSFFTVVTTVVEKDGSRMSRSSIYDQFICHIWLTEQPIWYFIATSTYGILLTAFERYSAVVYPIWHNSNVRTVLYVLRPSADRRIRRRKSAGKITAGRISRRILLTENPP